MGIPAAEIDQWPESELQRYIRYSNRHMLPQRRLELYLAQVAHISAVTMGGYKGDMRGFVLFDGGADDEPQETQTAGEEALFAGFSPE